MLFGAAGPDSVVQALAMVGSAAVAAWLSIERFRISSRVQDVEAAAKAEKVRCDGLEERVKMLEGIRRRQKKRRPPK